MCISRVFKMLEREYYVAEKNGIIPIASLYQATP
jgi:hypothetical protein